MDRKKRKQQKKNIEHTLWEEKAILEEARMQSASGPEGPPSGVEPPLGWNLAQREETGFPRIKYGAGLSSPE